MRKQCPNIVEIDCLVWCPVGPFDDPRTHLMAPLFFGESPMVLHAVEVVVDDDNNRMIATSPMKQFLVTAAEMVIGTQTPLKTVVLDGRDYLLITVPGIDGRRFS
jgi:hypothetical protein